MANKKYVSDTTLLVVFCFACSMITLLHKVDPAIAQSWPNNPYSPLWFALNPLAWTGGLQYKVELCALQGVAFFFMILANKRYGLPFKVAFLNVCVQMMWVLLGWEENTTVTMFAWAAWFAWPTALLALQKLPLGWSWNLRDAHVDCIRLCYYYVGGGVATTWLQVLDRDLLHYIVYAVCVLAVLYPLHVRRPLRRRAAELWWSFWDFVLGCLNGIFWRLSGSR